MAQRGMWLVSLIVVVFLFHSPSSLAAQPEEVTFPSGQLTLHGFIYKPEGAGPFPAVLYNHGSERKPGGKPEIGTCFSEKGYVLFVPHRRGHGRSPADSFTDSLYDRGAQGLIALHEMHLEDTAAALTYLRTLPYVDFNRIAVAGCSYGGIQTLLAAEKGMGLRAAISFAAAAESWNQSASIQSRLLRAVRQATIPILFIQAENDYNLAPSLVLAKEMEKSGKPYKRVIFPPYGKTHEEGHGGFCFQAPNIWGAEALSFLNDSMPR
jgi:carboxymethylenebutenolidase